MTVQDAQGMASDGPRNDVLAILVVHGAPRTKKTHNAVVRAGKRTVVLPSKQWREWVKTAGIGGWNARGHRVISEPVNCRAIFYRDADRGDAVGYYQGLADLLEKRGIVANDKWIRSWDGSRLEVDRERPRVEITLERIGEG